MNKKLRVFLASISIITIAAVILLYLIVDTSTIKSNSSYSPGPPESIKYSKENKRFEINYVITSEDLDGIIFSKLKDNPNVRALKTEIGNEEITIHISSKIAGLPTVYTFQVNVSGDSNSLKFYLLKTKIGKMPVPRLLVLKSLKAYSVSNIVVDEGKNLITINNITEMEPFEIISLSAGDGKINLVLGYTINSLKDVLKLLEYGLADNVRSYIEKFISTSQWFK